MKVLGIGNALVDIMTRLDNDNHLEVFKLPKGSMILVDAERSKAVIDGTNHLEKTRASGGSAANTIHGLARLGLETSFIGKTGKDELGLFFVDDLRSNKIKPLIVESETESGRAVALVSEDSERTFATYLGAAVELTADDLDDEQFAGHDLFYIEGYLVQNHQLIEKSLQLAKKHNLKVALDLASYNVVEENLDFLKRIVGQYVDILFANESEAEAFTGKKPEEALAEIAEMVEIAVVKTGSDGSMIKQNDTVIKVEVIDAECIDTTGAGDLYASGFIYGLSRGLSLEDCGSLGSLLAGNIIEVMGAKMDDIRWRKIYDIISREYYTQK